MTRRFATGSRREFLQAGAVAMIGAEFGAGRAFASAAELLDLTPGDVMMVAAHLGDLRAAKGVGLRTAFVPRPREYGPTRTPDLKADSSVDVPANDFNDLAAQLGA